MDQYMYEDQVIEANLGDRTDLNYDNDALDVLTELFDNVDNNIPDEILNTQPVRDSPLPNHPSNHALPDSPPYSGSEAYSPDNNKLLSPSACSEVSSRSSGYTSGRSPDPPAHTFHPAAMNQQQQLHNHLMQQQQQQQLHHQQMQQLHERQLLQQHLQQQAALQNGGQMVVPPMMQRPNTGPVNLPQLVPENHLRGGDAPQTFNGDAHSQFGPGNKKRKYVSESPPLSENQFLQQQQQLQQLQVKQEPVVPPHTAPHPAPHSTPHPAPQACDYEPDASSQSMDISPGMLNGGSYQPIKWREFQKTAWCPLVSTQGQRVNVQTYRLDGDKGFNFSQIDKAFVCQKKNHFQITSCLSFVDAPQYVMTPEGPKPVEGLYMHFYGVKEEAPNQLIQVDQSQADRSKRKFDPVALHPNPEHSWKITIGRLHFSDTTLNNMRKRGKPNPDQRYFLLIVGIFAHSQGKEYPVVQQCSEKLIVRASNPGQFQDSEAEPVKWQPGQTPNTVFHSGKVGINTDTPDEALTVAGNVKVMGTIMQPSDRRVKEDITEADTKEQLKNLQAISLYNYRYTEEFADAVGLDDKNAVETGVIAQELEVVIPEAVKTTTDVRLPNGEIIDSLKVVDKNRLFMESLGAVKELCNVTDSLENKITYLERFNQKLKKLKRIGSLRSTASNASDLSHVTSISTVSRVTVHRKRRTDRCSSVMAGDKGKAAGTAQGVCSNRFLQILIFVLVFVMVACVGVVLALLLNNNFNADENAASSSNGGEGSQSDAERVTPPSEFKRPTTVSAWQKTVDEWLLGDGCAEGEPHCEWTHCRNQCKSFHDVHAEVNANFSKPSYSAPPQFEPMKSYSIELGMTSESTNEIYYEEQRKKRSVADVNNPAEALKIGLTSPVEFNINSTRCLDCGSNIYNYTYGVQVSHSFPATNADLKIALKSGVPKPRWTKVAICPIPTEPAEFYSAPCDVDQVSNPDRMFNITPTNPITPQTLSRSGTEFKVAVGKTLKNVVIFRLADSSVNAATNDDLCQRPLGSHVVEFRVWFVRVCYRMPQTIDIIRDAVRLPPPPSTESPFGSARLDLDKINNNPRPT